MHQTAFDSAYTAITADGARWLADNLPSVRLRGWQAGECRPLALGAERQQTAAGSLRDNGMLSLLNVSPWTHTHLPSRQLNAPCLPPTLAAQLRAVGMDYLSVATLEEIVDAHLAILGSVSAQGSAECVRGRAAAALRWMCTAWFGQLSCAACLLRSAAVAPPQHTASATAMQGIVAVEGLVLDQVQPGIYTMHALPLKIAGADGAPARVILTQ